MAEFRFRWQKDSGSAGKYLAQPTVLAARDAESAQLHAELERLRAEVKAAQAAKQLIYERDLS